MLDMLVFMSYIYVPLRIIVKLKYKDKKSLDGLVPNRQNTSAKTQALSVKFPYYDHWKEQKLEPNEHRVR